LFFDLMSPPFAPAQLYLPDLMRETALSFPLLS
jgi:hypothetical protein